MGNCSKVAVREIERVRITRDPPMRSVNIRAINGRKTLVRITASPARVERRIFFSPESGSGCYPAGASGPNAFDSGRVVRLDRGAGRPGSALQVRATLGFLPDPDAVLRLDVVRVPLLHVERRVPGVDVAERRESADGAGRVRVRREHLAELVVALQRTPDLRPAEEYPLLSGETVDHRRRLSVERSLVGVEREQDAAQVADVLAHRQPPDDVLVRKLRELVGLVLRAELRRLRLELRGVIRRPPVPEHSAAVGLSSVVVESVRDLVADDGSDSAVVQ